MDDYSPPLHCLSSAAFGDGDAEEDEQQMKKSPTVPGDACGGDDAEDSRQWRRFHKARRDARLKANVDKILRELRTPLRDVVRDHVLPRLPVQSLLRFSSVSADWRNLISVPIFRHRQSHAHRSASGVFLQSVPGVPAYSPFDPLAGAVPDPSLAFLPGDPRVLASSNGLLCCASVACSYYVCNPSTADWTRLPKPPSPRLGLLEESEGRAAFALVFEPSAANLEGDYHLVRAFEVPGDFEGVYGFQVFSSSVGAWQTSSDVCAAERLVHGSGVSAGGVAYWRTTMQTVLAYDPAADRCRTLLWPMGYDATAQWQLGEMGGRLCCACVTDSAVMVYALAAGDRWALLASYRVMEREDDGELAVGGSPPVFRCRPWPLRFQSGDCEVLLWVGGGVVGLDVASGTVRVAFVAPGEPLMDPFAEYVPHISTFAPVFPQWN